MILLASRWCLRVHQLRVADAEQMTRRTEQVVLMAIRNGSQNVSASEAKQAAVKLVAAKIALIHMVRDRLQSLRRKK